MHWSLFPVVIHFGNNVGWFTTESAELLEGKNQTGLLSEHPPVFDNEKNTGWPPDGF